MDEKEIFRCIHDPEYLIKKYFKGKKFCMAAHDKKCEGKIIEAHLLSKVFLKNLATNNHVYTLSNSFHKERLTEITKKGINQVSTINNFCEHHDKILFSSFENTNFKSNFKQIYDISFRTLCGNFFSRKCLLKFMNEFKDGRLKSLVSPDIDDSIFNQQVSHCQRELKDLEFLYQLFIKQSNKKFNNCRLRYLVIKLSKLPIAASGIFFPLFNASGKLIQIEDQTNLQIGFIYNLFPLNDYSVCVISTVANNKNIFKKFLYPLRNLAKNPKELIDYLLTYIFFNINVNGAIIASPTWYENLDVNFKNLLLQMINNDIETSGEINLRFGKAMKFSDHMNSNDCIIIKSNI